MATTLAQWPELKLSDWESTYQTLHMWTQIVGKVKLELTPLVNHWWNVPLYVDARGLTTGGMLIHDRPIEIQFDFCAHKLIIDVADQKPLGFELEPMSVAEFYEKLMEQLDALGGVEINTMPVEISNPIRFTEDNKHASYDPDAAHRAFLILQQTQKVFQEFRARFIGKSSPVHFFWGAFDLAVTRFSGRLNPAPPPDRVMGEAYSHEVISHGFWPGGDWPTGGRMDEAVFYAYAVPEPEGFRTASISPKSAYYDEKFFEYVLPYEAIRTSQNPEAELMSFLETTYSAGADLAGWDRKALERR
jgi:hypothetical protein